jgi:putative membrane protein
MIDFVLRYYLWFKSAHIIMSIAWMAGLFYLPRLFVYHTQTEPGSDGYLRFVTMEEKLLTIIMLPALTATWIFGLINAWAMNYWLDGWFLAKLGLAVLMTVVHFLDSWWAYQFVRGRNVHSERFFRVWNEAPTLLMIGIVILVVVKPA